MLSERGAWKLILSPTLVPANRPPPCGTTVRVSCSASSRKEATLASSTKAAVMINSSEFSTISSQFSTTSKVTHTTPSNFRLARSGTKRAHRLRGSSEADDTQVRRAKRVANIVTADGALMRTEHPGRILRSLARDDRARQGMQERLPTFRKMSYATGFTVVGRRHSRSRQSGSPIVPSPIAPVSILLDTELSILPDTIVTLVTLLQKDFRGNLSGKQVQYK
eukprot:1195693-Prorocentrum_minimum.AAC.4